jgi:hypothetical protein
MVAKERWVFNVLGTELCVRDRAGRGDRAQNIGNLSFQGIKNYFFFRNIFIKARVYRSLTSISRASPNKI